MSNANLDIDLSRREFAIVSATAFVGTVKAQSNSYDFDGAALLAGPASARPAVGDPFFDNKIAYQYLYEETDTGRTFEINEDASAWSQINQLQDTDGDGLLEVPNKDGFDTNRAVIRDNVTFPTGGSNEYSIETQGGKLTVSASETGEVVGALNEHGILLPTSGVISSDTTVRTRTEIYQVDTSGGPVTLTIGTELENDDQIFAVKDVGGNAGLAQIEVVPESGTDIDGQSSASINSGYGRLSAYYSSAEGQWFSLFTSL